MVQIFPALTPTPSVAQSAMQGLASGVQKGFETSLNFKLNEMLEDKKVERQRNENAKMNLGLLGNAYGGAPPQVAVALHKLLVEHGGATRLNELEAALSGTSNEPPQEEEPPKRINPDEPISETTAQKPSLLAPGTAKTPQDEEVPAEEEIVRPEAIKGPRMGAPEQQPKTQTPEIEEGSVQDLQNRKREAVKTYNKERDPTVKKQMYTQLKDFDRLIQDRRNYELKLAREQRETRRDIAKENVLTKEDKAFVEKINKGMQSASRVGKVLDRLKGIRSKSYLGPGSWILSKNRKARGEYSVAGKELLPLVTELFPRGLTERTFKRIEDVWMPTPGDTESTLIGKEKGFEFLAEESKRMFDKMKSFQNPDGSYPKNIQSIVMSSIADDLDRVNNYFEQEPGSITEEQQTYKFNPGDVVEKLPNPSSVKPGDGFKDEYENTYVSDGTKWIKK